MISFGDLDTLSIKVIIDHNGKGRHRHRFIATKKHHAACAENISRLLDVPQRSWSRCLASYLQTNNTHFLHTNHITMKKYICDVCGYIYDPEKGDPDSGIAPGTPFEALPTNWKCPLCGIRKDRFSATNSVDGNYDY